jgi:hypothetical protein
VTLLLFTSAHCVFVSIPLLCFMPSTWEDLCLLPHSMMSKQALTHLDENVLGLWQGY